MENKMWYVVGFMSATKTITQSYDDLSCDEESESYKTNISVLGEMQHKTMCNMSAGIMDYSLDDIPIEALLSGVDEFYKDFKNLKISIQSAIYVVKNQIQGRSEEDIKRILLYLRSGNIDNLLVKDKDGKPVRYVSFP